MSLFQQVGQALVKISAVDFKPVAKLEQEVRSNYPKTEPGKYYPVPKSEQLTKRACVAELEVLGVLTDGQLGELRKFAQNVLIEPPPPPKPSISKEEAQYSLQRLKRLEEGRPTTDQIGRGALVGAVVSPLASLAYRTIAGRKIRAPTDQQLLPQLRTLMAQAGHGAVFGGLMPAVTNKLEREAESAKLREYLGQPKPKGRMRKAIESVVGVDDAQVDPRQS